MLDNNEYDLCAREEGASYTMHTYVRTYRMRCCRLVGVARSLAIVKIAAIIHVLPATETETTTTTKSAASFNWSKCSKCKLRNDLHFDWHILGELFVEPLHPGTGRSTLCLSTHALLVIQKYHPTSYQSQKLMFMTCVDRQMRACRIDEYWARTESAFKFKSALIEATPSEKLSAILLSLARQSSLVGVSYGRSSHRAPGSLTGSIKCWKDIYAAMPWTYWEWVNRVYMRWWKHFRLYLKLYNWNMYVHLSWTSIDLTWFLKHNFKMSNLAFESEIRFSILIRFSNCLSLFALFLYLRIFESRSSPFSCLMSNW